MKKYSIEWLAAARSKPLTRANPKPFPGKYPTRIAWQGRYKGQVISYVGKPSLRALQRFHTYRRRTPYMWAVEFDRAGVVGKRAEGGIITNAASRTYYHPVVDERVDFFLRPFRWITYTEPELIPAPPNFAAMLAGPFDANPRTLRLPRRQQRTSRRVCWPLDMPLPTGATV